MEVLLVALSDDLHEIRALIESAGYALAGEFVQHRRYPDPKWFVGKGKLEELKTVVKEKSPGAVVFAGALRANQHHALEKALQVQCFDRVRVILEIFTQRAHGREAKLQVELAMLHYEIPILKEWIHSASIGERPGFMSGGEYSVDASGPTDRDGRLRLGRPVVARRRVPLDVRGGVRVRPRPPGHRRLRFHRRREEEGGVGGLDARPWNRAGAGTTCPDEGGPSGRRGDPAMPRRPSSGPVPSAAPHRLHQSEILARRAPRRHP